VTITLLTDLITAIKAQVTGAIGFQELPLVIDPQKNAKRMTRQKFGIIPGSATQISGQTRFYTMDHSFIIELTDDYINTKASDEGKRAATNNLINKAHDVFKALIKNKAGLPGVVMNVKELSLQEPVYFEEEDTVVLNMGFIITYRVQF